MGWCENEKISYELVCRDAPPEHPSSPASGSETAADVVVVCL